MKTTKRIIAMTAALALSACMAVPVSMMTASATSVTINTSADNTTHTYSAYQIFTGSLNTNGLTITGWGSGFDSDGLLNDADFKALVITPASGGTPAVTVGSFIGTKTDAATAAQAIEKLNYLNDSAQADELAAILYKYIGSTADKTLSDTAVDMGAGYWIVTDSYTANSTNDAVSKFILRVSGGTEAISINPKKSYPTVVKKVQENSDVSDYTGMDETESNYNDVADYCIGDAVPFRIYGSMPDNLDDYAHYYYKFTDTLGTQFDQPTSITIKIGTTTLTAAWDSTENKYTITGDTGTNCRVKWDSTNNKLDISFEDIKAYSGVTSATVVTVSYTAELNENANIGLSGQENKVDLTYSNNPNFEYTPNTSNEDEDVPKDDKETPDTDDDEEVTDKTPEDKVIVFTYQQNIKKIDSATGNPLSAGFTLSRANGATTEYVLVDTDGKVTGWTTDAAAASVLTTDASTGLYSVIGLDEGTYTLKEKTPPTGGYNAITNDMTLIINATTQNGQAWDGAPASALTAIALTASGDTHITDDSANLIAADAATNGIVQAKITNDKGINLPETGGIGTTLFILGGGCAAGIGGIYLISKKRTGKEE